MNFLSDWGFWAFVMTLILGAFSWFSHIKITTNDLKHLEDDVKKISEKQESNETILNVIATDIAFIKGKTEANDKIIEVLEKSLNK